MKALILGGTSFFGKDIARCFHQAGFQVTLFTRGQHQPDDLPPHQHIGGDRRNKDDLHRAARSGPWDVVVDNIAFEGEEVRAALEAFRGTKRYLLCSTLSVYRYAPESWQPIREDAVNYDYRPAQEDLADIHWKYASGKRDCERACLTQDAVPFTIIRPPVVYGPDDPTNRGFHYLLRLTDGDPVILANGGENSFRLAYSEDVAKAFVQAASCERAKGRTYNVAQGEILTLKRFVEDSAQALGVKPDLVNIPFELCADFAGDYAAMVNVIPDISAAQSEIGYRPTPWPMFCAATAQWFRDHFKGDRELLLENRPRELELIRRWREATTPFHP